MPRNDPTHLRLTRRNRNGCQVYIKTGFGISGRDVVAFPSNPESAAWARLQMRRGVMEEATVEEYNEAKGIDAPQATVASSGTSGDAPTEAAGGSEEASDDEYDSMSKADLVDECKVRELPHGGTKDELIARLREDDANNG